MATDKELKENLRHGLITQSIAEIMKKIRESVNIVVGVNQNNYGRANKKW